MKPSDMTCLTAIVHRDENAILGDWLANQLATQGRRRDLVDEAEVEQQSRTFLAALRRAVHSHASDDGAWDDVRQFLVELSRTRAYQGFTPAETATFVMSLKQPLFARLQSALREDATALGRELWACTELLDRLGLATVEAHQRSREEIIARQQRELLELSTPVVQLWEEILALPLVGTLDSERTQIVMETLLQKIVDTGAAVAILDITGVPTVDTLVAQHLMKTVAAEAL